MSAVLEASGLGKRYGPRWALTGCSLKIPVGRVVGLVGPNGAGKSTLLQLAVGLLAPSAGSITVLGGAPGGRADQLRKVGFVAQEAPTYAGLSGGDHLRFGAWSNDGFDRQDALQRCESLGLDLRQRAGRLSGGQRAQLALTLALAKRPELLVLDEPVASLDPLARREFLQLLMEAVAEDALSVILSSHLVAGLERVCDSYSPTLAGTPMAGRPHRSLGWRHDPYLLLAVPPSAQHRTRRPRHGGGHRRPDRPRDCPPVRHDGRDVRKQRRGLLDGAQLVQCP